MEKHRQRLAELGIWPLATPPPPKPTLTPAQLEQALVIADARFFGDTRVREFTEKSLIDLLRFAKQQRAARGMEPLSDDEAVEMAWLLPSPDDWGRIMLPYSMFLRGLLPASPTHAGALTYDVANATQAALLDIVRLGFVTVDSQPGTCAPFHNAETGDDGIELQREYIEGVYLKQFAKPLLDQMVARGFYVRLISGDGTAITRQPADMETSVADKLQTDARGRNRQLLPFTVEKVIAAASAESDDPSAGWEVPTGHWMSRDEAADVLIGLDDRWDDARQWINDNTYTFVIAAPRFCEPGFLAAHLRDALATIALQYYETDQRYQASRKEERADKR